MEDLSNRFIISTDKTKLNIDFIHHFLSRSYWAENIPISTVQRSITGSMCFGIYDIHNKGEQVGFARVVTDNATFGHLADVFIDERYRGQGLSKMLMQAIMSHPDLQGFRSWQLATKDAHGLYEKFGFTRLDNADRVMRKFDPDVYRKTS
jgi:N-acetylglutamate synthase-like GNAT family acetyltransferase